MSEVYCYYCKQPLWSEPGEQGLEVTNCVTCIAKLEADIYRQFIKSLPNSLLAAARTLEQEDTK